MVAAREALVLFLRGRTVRTAAPVAGVVGTVLSVVNQGQLVLDGGGGTGTWIRIAVNYAVPFVVASIGFLSARGTPAGITDLEDRVGRDARG